MSGCLCKVHIVLASQPAQAWPSNAVEVVVCSFSKAVCQSQLEHYLKFVPEAVCISGLSLRALRKHKGVSTCNVAGCNTFIGEALLLNGCHIDLCLCKHGMAVAELMACSLLLTASLSSTWRQQSWVRDKQPRTLSIVSPVATVLTCFTSGTWSPPAQASTRLSPGLQIGQSIQPPGVRQRNVQRDRSESALQQAAIPRGILQYMHVIHQDPRLHRL